MFRAAHCDSEAAWKQHRAAASAIAPAIANAVSAFRRDLNVVLSRGVWRMFAVTTAQYRRALDARALLDFSGVLERAVDLLKQMDEFARSRYRLESRYHHVLVDEFQDTSRAQWDLVEQLIRSWSEGLGASADALPPSIFIVGDRKQAIYGFRDAEVALLDEAARFIAALRPRTSGTRGAPCRSASGRPRRCSGSSTTCSARSRATRRAAPTRSGTASWIDFRCRPTIPELDAERSRPEARAADASGAEA